MNMVLPVLQSARKDCRPDRRLLELRSYITIVCWQFNYDAPGQTGSFLQSYFEYLCLTSLFSSVFASHSASNSRVAEFQKLF